MTYSSISDHGIEELDLSNAGNHNQESEAIERSAALDVVMPSSSVVDGFHYTGVTAEVAKEAEATANRIRDRHRTSIIDTGYDLCAVKEKLEHGLFGKWLRFHFNMSERTAQNYMNVAIVFGSTPKVIDVLPPTTVYKLAAKGASEQIRQSVIEGVAKGLSLNHMEIDSRIALAQKEERQKREAEHAVKQKQRDWQKHEKALRAEGKTDDDIEKERKRWDTKKAEKVTDVQNKSADVEHRQVAASVSQTKMEKLAQRVAQHLKTRLSDDYEEFLEAFIKIYHRQLKTAPVNT